MYVCAHCLQRIKHQPVLFYSGQHIFDAKLTTPRPDRGQMLNAEVNLSRPKPRPKFWLRGQTGLNKSTSFRPRVTLPPPKLRMLRALNAFLRHEVMQNERFTNQRMTLHNVVKYSAVRVLRKVTIQWCCVYHTNVHL